jgi:hypothetical protein
VFVLLGQDTDGDRAWRADINDDGAVTMRYRSEGYVTGRGVMAVLAGVVGPLGGVLLLAERVPDAPVLASLVIVVGVGSATALALAAARGGVVVSPDGHIVIRGFWGRRVVARDSVRAVLIRVDGQPKGFLDTGGRSAVLSGTWARHRHGLPKSGDCPSCAGDWKVLNNIARAIDVPLVAVSGRQNQPVVPPVK